MKFVVSSTQLLAHLQSIARVINSKNSLPILDNFLFNLKDSELIITASDLETTLTTKIGIENSDENGMIAIPSKILMDTLREFPEQPLSFNINIEESTIAILSANGKFNIVGNEGGDFPKSPSIKEKFTSVTMSPSALLNGISRTIFATSDDELKPVMNGIFVQLQEDSMTMVASDSHKLVRFRRFDVKAETESNFILPKKPAGLLKNILPKEDGLLKLSFDEKNAFFELTNYTMICRLIEGKYPAYQTVIPTTNPYKLIIDRIGLANSIRRVAVFSSQASNLIKMQMGGNEITISAQDIDFSISAYEKHICQYEGDALEIGFKSSFLVELLNNSNCVDTIIEMSDPSRPGVITALDKDNENEDVLMLIMPMMLNS